MAGGKTEKWLLLEISDVEENQWERRGVEMFVFSEEFNFESIQFFFVKKFDIIDVNIVVDLEEVSF